MFMHEMWRLCDGCQLHSAGISQTAAEGVMCCFHLLIIRSSVPLEPLLTVTVVSTDLSIYMLCNILRLLHL